MSSEIRIVAIWAIVVITLAILASIFLHGCAQPPHTVNKGEDQLWTVLKYHENHPTVP